MEAQGEEQRQEYISKCLDRIRGIHGSLDGTQFIPMVVTNSDYAPRLGIESEGESVTDSPPNYDLAYAHTGDHHGHRVEIRGIPVKAGVGA